MKRYIATLSILALAACGGGSSAPHPLAAPTATPVVSSLKTGNVALSIKIPRRTFSASARRPKFIPSGAERLDVNFTGSISGTQSFNFETDCANTAPDTFVCALNLAPGNYTLIAQMFDGPSGSANMLATSANVVPATSLTVAGGTQSAAISMQGIVSQVYLQTPTVCANPSDLATTGLPVRFLDADGQEIQGQFAYPVTVSSTLPAALEIKSTGGTFSNGTPITIDPAVTSTAYPLTPAFVLASDGVSEGTPLLTATSANPTPISLGFGTGVSTSALAFVVAKHMLLVANPSSPDVAIIGALPGALDQCGVISTPLVGVQTIIADGANDSVVVAGTNAATTGVVGVVEYRLAPSTFTVNLGAARPTTVYTGASTLISEGTGVMSLARSQATHVIYVGDSVGPGIAAFSDASFPLNPSSTTPARYQTGDPISLVAGRPFSIAVVNTPLNGDVLFIPDSTGGGNVGIVTHAGTFGAELGLNFDLHLVTPDGPDPLFGYSTASYVNGSARVITFTLNDNGLGQIHSFDANFVSIPVFNRSGLGGFVPSPNTLTTGNGDSNAFVNDAGNGICFPTIGNPVGFPFSCDASEQVTTIGTAGDNTYLAAVTTSGFLRLLSAPPPLIVNAQVSIVAGAIPAFYTR
jgi:hypothetical protein